MLHVNCWPTCYFSAACIVRKSQVCRQCQSWPHLLEEFARSCFFFAVPICSGAADEKKSSKKGRKEGEKKKRKRYWDSYRTEVKGSIEGYMWHLRFLLFLGVAIGSFGGVGNHFRGQSEDLGGGHSGDEDAFECHHAGGLDLEAALVWHSGDLSLGPS